MISDLSFGFFLQGFDSLLLQSMFPWMLPCPSMMLASHGNAPLTHQAAWFKPWKRLWNKICSRWNKRADWGFLVLIPHHCEIHGFERLSPAAAVHENWQQGIVYKSGANMHNTPEKRPKHNVFPNKDSSIQERKSQAKELWMRVLQRGSLLCFETEWWITTGWNGHCDGHLLQRKHQWKDKGR